MQNYALMHREGLKVNCVTKTIFNECLVLFLPLLLFGHDIHVIVQQVMYSLCTLEAPNLTIECTLA